MSPPTTPSIAEARCPHCGTAVEGDADAYCCAGCEMAAAIIRDAGLDAYYETREQYAPRPGPADGGWSAVPVGDAPDGLKEARLQVDGLRCASCVWVVERVLEHTPGVARATVSYATGRATVRWDPERLDLAAVAGRIAALGYRPRALGAEARPDGGLLLRLGVAAFAAANIMLLYATLYLGWWQAMAPEYAALFRWASLTLATPVALWCASPFFKGAAAGLRARVLHMDLPIALAVAILYAHGVVATLLGRDAYLDSLAMLVALLLAGRLLEARGRRRAAEAALSLVASVPRSARRATAAGLETVAVSSLRPGDLIDLGAGEEIPADGTVTEGGGTLQVALLTGEADPVPVGPGGTVHAGTVLLDGALSVRVEAVGGETLLHRMAAELRAAADRPLRPTGADRIAPWFTAGTLVVAALTFAGWSLGAGVGAGLARTVAVLVVACPCALALAHPLAAAAGLGAAARRGLLLRSGDTLLDMAVLDVIAFDKTGTMTEGVLAVTEAGDEALRTAAALERFSAHPIARAIVTETVRRGIPLPRGEDVREQAGVGMTGVVDGRRWTLCAEPAGGVVVSDGEGMSQSIRLGDTARSDAARTVAALHAEGLEVALLTGDHADAAGRIGRLAGVDAVAARMDPEAKAAWVRGRQATGQRVLFAGDGLNDGPALAAADVALAMGSGAASSVLVADGVLSGATLGPILAGRRAARAAAFAIRASQRRSVAYNLLAVGAAAAGLVNPLVAAVLMPLSSAMVVWGAFRVETLVRREEAACRP